MILVKESAPDPASLGVTNGITQFAMVRTPSPSPLSSVYSTNTSARDMTWADSLAILHPHQCLSRSFSPAFASSLLAFSTGHEFILLHYLWVLVMTTIAFLGTTLSRRIAEGRRAPAHP